MKNSSEPSTVSMTLGLVLCLLGSAGCGAGADGDSNADDDVELRADGVTTDAGDTVESCTAQPYLIRATIRKVYTCDAGCLNPVFYYSEPTASPYPTLQNRASNLPISGTPTLERYKQPWSWRLTNGTS